MHSERPVPIDLRYSQLRSVLAAEAAKAYMILGGTQEPETVLWETMAVAGRRNRVLQLLIGNPGLFIAGLYNSYGPDEYPKWLVELNQNIEELKTVDQQG
jgi:hypothetical protein